MGRLTSRRHFKSDDPFFFALTEEERLHGLDLFGDESTQTEPPQVEPPQKESSKVYDIERATPPIPPEVRRAPPVRRKPSSPQMWQAPLLAAAPLSAAVLTAAVLVYAVMTVRVARTTDSRIATVPATAAVAVLPSRATPPVTDAPAAVVSRASAPLPAPARSAPPIQPASVSRSLSVSRPKTAEPPPILAATIAPVPSSPALPASLPVEPRPVVAAPASLPRAEASAAPVPSLPAPETAIQTVLSQYRTAYRDLDAGAARAIWPSVDTKALRKAFDRLERQDLIFDSCQIAVRDLRAVASCNGFAWYVPRVGSKGPHDDQRQWEFKLSKVDDAWLIDTVSAR